MIDRLRAFFEELGWSPWAGALAVLLASYFVARLVDWMAVRVLRRIARRSPGDTDDRIIDAVQGPIVKTVVLAGLYAATILLDLDAPEAGEEPTRYTEITAHALVTVGILIWIVAALRLVSTLLRAATSLESRFVAIEERTLPLFDNASKVLLVAAGVYAVIRVWGLDATGWLASAGIVGLAVGLAAQESLANLFSGVFIIADSPYNVGDFINLESGERGQVIQIGLRSTRLRTRDDIEITIPNSVMGRARITNETAGESSKRRLRVAVGVAYGSDVRRVKELLLEIANAEELVCDEPAARVRFSGPSASPRSISSCCAGSPSRSCVGVRSIRSTPRSTKRSRSRRSRFRTPSATFTCSRCRSGPRTVNLEACCASHPSSCSHFLVWRVPTRTTSPTSTCVRFRRSTRLTWRSNAPRPRRSSARSFPRRRRARSRSC
ncbi:MAG: mechanosensitive ion channel family protein [bacterium]|nr:mechanosensitive ion channel family protein [bacterium]